MLTSNEAVKVRIHIVVLILLGLFIYIGVTLYHLQITRHKELYDKAKRQYTTVQTTRGKRGEIRDIEGNLLVGNIPRNDIIVDPTNVQSDDHARKLAYLLQRYLKIDFDETYRKLSRKKRMVKNSKGEPVEVKVRYAMLARDVPFEEGNRLKYLIELNDIKGVTFRERYKRYYPKGVLMANMLGFTSTDSGVTGVEKVTEETVKPDVSVIIYERDANGRELPYGARHSEVGKHGEHVYLTVCEPIQAIVEEELDKAMEKWKPKTAYAVMADPRTGNIMAIAQRPTFDPNDRSKMSGEAYRLRALEDSFEPGSVMKPLVVSGALDMGVVTPNTMIDCENGLWVYLNRSMRDTHPAKMVSVADIIKHSSNIGTAKIGLKLGEKNLNRILRGFGLGSHTGIPIRPETVGQFRPVNRWDGLSITRFPIGYGVGVSPVQMLRAYCALADGGNLRKLRLIDRIVDSETGEEKYMPLEEPIKLYQNPERTNAIVDMMASVTRKDGTAFRAAIPGYEVAGKTGTSRKWMNGAYSYSRSYATFAGFVPARDPAFVLVVVVDEAVGSIYGGVIAAPVFREIAARTLKYLDVKPDPALMEPEDKAKAAASARPATAPKPQTVKPSTAPKSNYYQRGYQNKKRTRPQNTRL